MINLCVASISFTLALDSSIALPSPVTDWNLVKKLEQKPKPTEINPITFEYMGKVCRTLAGLQRFLSEIGLKELLADLLEYQTLDSLVRYILKELRILK